MSFLAVIFVVLMIFALLVGGYWGYSGEPAGRPLRLGGYTLLWACVAILGWVVFNGSSIPTR